MLSACHQQPQLQHLPGASAQAGAHKSQSQWYCKGDENKQWHCSNQVGQQFQTKAENQTTEVIGTDTDTITEPEPIIEPPDNSQTVTHATGSTSNQQAPKPLSQSVLTSYPDHYVAVQLMAARQQQTITDFIERHPQLNSTAVITLQHGEWYLALLGIYADYGQAQQAIRAIDPPLKNKPWVRPFKPLKNSIGTK